jgi:class 3 adenylate cyclase/predicted ATPase
VDCPKCGSANPDDRRYCVKCGAAVVLRCGGCGAENAPTSIFCGDCGATLSRPERSAAGDQASGLGAERRQLTLMFCDIVGSTALSVTLDPEDLRDIIAAYHRCCADIVGRYRGMIARFMGDGALAYFGYPQAHEDDAECAVRAGLALIEAMSRLETGRGAARLQVRIGVATGLVVVGDLVGEGAAREQAVVGQTPNLAARLQTLAEPGTVVISASTRQLVGGLFEYVDLGTHVLKGFTAPVRAWQVIGESAAASRFEALRASALSPLVNREHELTVLFERWEKAKEGAGQIVLLSGEAGLGKSRLAQAVSDALGELKVPRLHYYCSPFHRNSALYPLLEQFKRAAGFARNDVAEVKLRKLEGLMARFGHGRDSIALIAHLLSIPGGERFPPPVLDGQTQKEMMLSVLSGLLVRLARRRPVLIVAEDLHWSDPTSLELLGLLVTLVPTLPVLMIVSFRPELTLNWSGEHVATVQVDRLTRQHSRLLLSQLTDEKAIPADISGQIMERTDGIPLFIEEMTKAVIESGVLQDAGDRYELARSAPSSSIPATLRDSLMARLDRLADVKTVAQTGAAIGRSFSYELLAAISPLAEGVLQEGLRRLTASGLIFARGTPPRADYTFKHALVQETAYESLLRGRRQDLHAAIARALSDHFPDVKTTQPEVLAHHYTLAGDGDEAVGYWVEAGQRATERSAELEAIGHLQKALEVLQTLPATPSRDKRELGIRIALLTPTIALKGYASPETAEAAAKARTIADRVGDAGQLFPIMYGEWTSNVVRGKIHASRDLATHYLRLAKRQADSTPLVVGHRMLGVSLWALGELAPAREELERTIGLYDPKVHASSAFRYAHDSRVSTLSHLAVACLISGDPRRTFAAAQEACRYAEELKHANTHAVALCLAGAMVGAVSRDAARVRDFTARTIRLAEDHGLALWLAAGRLYEAWLLADQGQPGDAISAMTTAMDRFKAIGVKFTVPHFLGLLAEVHTASGRAEQGLGVVADALATIDETGERIWLANLYRIQGELQLSCGGPVAEAAAEAAFERAIDVARSQGALFWELRATTALARLHLGRGSRRDMRPRLTAAWQPFADDGGLRDVAEAKALIDRLGGAAANQVSRKDASGDILASREGAAMGAPGGGATAALPD